nr:hypothetical protein BaRGS_004149 [Batillaria attramentaria]
MPTHGGGAIGSLDYTPEERKVLAKKSQDWKCPDCGVVSNKLKPVTQASEKVSQEAKILAAQINFQGGHPQRDNDIYPNIIGTDYCTPSGLRQRQTGAAPSPPQQSATTTTTTTTDTREAESQRVSLVMMVVLAFAIGLLLARRMYIQFFSPHFRGVMN